MIGVGNLVRFGVEYVGEKWFWVLGFFWGLVWFTIGGGFGVENYCWILVVVEFY